MKREKNRL